MVRNPLVAALLGVVVLAGCATTPSTNVYQPMSARPVPQPESMASNGSIYQAGSARMNLFEDRRARNVGDTLTVVINEKNAASSKSNKTASTSGSNSMTMNPNLFAGSGSTSTSLFSSSSSGKSENKGENANNGAFTGTITVTVVEVLPNGNLIVSGEKQVAVEQRTEYLRLSGVVNPMNVTSANTVSSTQIADARVEYKGTDALDKAQFLSMITRFFLTVLP